MAKAATPDLEDLEIKEKYYTKVDQVYSLYETEVKTIADALMDENQTLSLATMREAVRQGKKLIAAKNQLQDDHLVTISSVDPQLKTLIHWIDRCYNRFVEKVNGKTSTQKHAHTLDSILQKMGNEKLQQLQAMGEQSCGSLMKFSKIAQLLLPKVQDRKHDLDIRQLLDCEVRTLRNLRQQLKKAQNLNENLNNKD